MLCNSNEFFLAHGENLFFKRKYSKYSKFFCAVETISPVSTYEVFTSNASGMLIIA